MSEKWQQSEMCIAIIDKLQVNIAKHLSYDGLLHHKYIIQFGCERIFKISKYLAKLQVKWLIVSYTPFAFDVCPKRCRSCQISKITAANCCYVNKQINVSLLSTNIKLL